jgi:hypothetical protein
MRRLCSQTVANTPYNGGPDLVRGRVPATLHGNIDQFNDLDFRVALWHGFVGQDDRINAILKNDTSLGFFIELRPGVLVSRCSYPNNLRRKGTQGRQA